MVNHPLYRWKEMIGPRDRRPMHAGLWYAHSTNGWGIFDFLNFAEAAGFVAIPAVNASESAQDMADFVEYVNGPADSEWGKQRAADGHPAP
jgi:alpha-L-arabinofuranosidase